MIKGIIMLSDDTRVFESYFTHPPRVGEYLWVTTSAGDSVRMQHGTTAFIVKEIAHWCVPGYVPNPGQDALHKIAIYVEPIIEAEAPDGPRT